MRACRSCLAYVLRTIGTFLPASVVVLGAAPPSSDTPSREGVEAQLKDAQEYADQGKHLLAAQRFEQIAAEVPNSPKGQCAAVRAAANYDLAGEYAQAIEQHDRAIHMAAKPYWTQAALYGKALTCEKAGRGQDAVQAIDRLKIEFPESSFWLEALAVKARVTGMDANAFQALKSKEEQAASLLSEARLELDELKDAEAALPYLARIETEYPNTAAAVAALRTKAMALERLRRFPEACAVYAQLLARISAVAPGSDAADDVEYRLAGGTLRWAELVYDDSFKNRTPPGAPVWNDVRSHCNQVLKLGRNQRQMATARIMLISLDLVERNPARAGALAKEFLRQYAGLRKFKRFPKQVMAAHILAGEAARLTGRPDEALEHNNTVKELFAQLDFKEQTNPRIASLHRLAYYKCFLTLTWVRADEAQIRQAGEEVITRFPDSAYADAVGKRLRSTTMPSP